MAAVQPVLLLLVKTLPDILLTQIFLMKAYVKGRPTGKYFLLSLVQLRQQVRSAAGNAEEQTGAAIVDNAFDAIHHVVLYHSDCIQTPMAEHFHAGKGVPQGNDLAVYIMLLDEVPQHNLGGAVGLHANAQPLQCLRTSHVFNGSVIVDQHMIILSSHWHTGERYVSVISLLRGDSSHYIHLSPVKLSQQFVMTAVYILIFPSGMLCYLLNISISIAAFRDVIGISGLVCVIVSKIANPHDFFFGFCHRQTGKKGN